MAVEAVNVGICSHSKEVAGSKQTGRDRLCILISVWPQDTHQELTIDSECPLSGNKGNRASGP